MKNQKVKFTATGNVLGNLWGSGKGGYHATQITADTESEIIKIAKEKLKDGSLDAGAGFENLIGAILIIEKVTTVEIDGDLFTNKKVGLAKYIGALTEKERKFLAEDYFNSHN